METAAGPAYARAGGFSDGAGDDSALALESLKRFAKVNWHDDVDGSAARELLSDPEKLKASTTWLKHLREAHALTLPPGAAQQRPERTRRRAAAGEAQASEAGLLAAAHSADGWPGTIGAIVSQILGERALLMATTGTAAFLIGGSTIHSTLSVPIDLENLEKNIKGENLRRIQSVVKGREWIVIDEASMMGKKLLLGVDQRLREATGNLNVAFGGLNVLLVGDGNQLPPVGDEVTYTCDSAKTKGRKLDAFNLYRRFDHVELLQKSERRRQMLQKARDDVEAAAPGSDEQRCRQQILRDELAFGVLLRRLATMQLTQADWRLLESRCPRAVAPRYARGAASMPPSTADAEDDEWSDATRLFYRNRDVDDYNHRKLLELGTPIARLVAKNSPAKASRVDSSNAGGLRSTLYLAKCARVMLTNNSWVYYGLHNGARGTVLDIVYKNADGPQRGELPELVIFRFDNYDGTPFIAGQPGTIAITVSTFTFPLTGNSNTMATREQVPLRLCWAITIHKSQGATLDRIVVDIGESEMCAGMTLVALSRVRSIRHLMIHEFLCDRLMKINDSVPVRGRATEMKRLTRLAEALVRRNPRLGDGEAAVDIGAAEEAEMRELQVILEPFETAAAAARAVARGVSRTAVAAHADAVAGGARAATTSRNPASTRAPASPDTTMAAAAAASRRQRRPHSLSLSANESTGDIAVSSASRYNFGGGDAAIPHEDEPTTRAKKAPSPPPPVLSVLAVRAQLRRPDITYLAFRSILQSLLRTAPDSSSASSSKRRPKMKTRASVANVVDDSVTLLSRGVSDQASSVMQAPDVNPENADAAVVYFAGLGSFSRNFIIAVGAIYNYQDQVCDRERCRAWLSQLAQMHRDQRFDASDLLASPSIFVRSHHHHPPVSIEHMAEFCILHLCSESAPAHIPSLLSTCASSTLRLCVRANECGLDCSIVGTYTNLLMQYHSSRNVTTVTPAELEAGGPHQIANIAIVDFCTAVIGLRDDRLLLMPINLRQAHWGAIAVDAAAHQILIFDPYGRSSPFYPQIEAFASDAVQQLPSSWRVQCADTTLRQKDNNNCGVFVLMWFEMLLANVDAHNLLLRVLSMLRIISVLTPLLIPPLPNNSTSGYYRRRLRRFKKTAPALPLPLRLCRYAPTIQHSTGGTTIASNPARKVHEEREVGSVPD